ncbi:MAG TPA: META domain-containing protein [Acidimicrobiia bacterium]
MRLSLTGTWAVTAYRTDAGMVEMSAEGGEAQLDIEDQTVAGTMGVNRFTGQLVDGLLGPGLAMTRMAGPPDLMSQENTLMSHLHEADTVVVTDEGMTFSRDGLELVELRRSGTNGPDASS